MNYEELCYTEDKAWTAFLDVLESAGINRTKLRDHLDRKDCFNSVSDAVMEAGRSILIGEE